MNSSGPIHLHLFVVIVLWSYRNEVKKHADESEDILDNTPGGKKGESALRLFIKVLCHYYYFAHECNIIGYLIYVIYIWI